MMLIITPLTGWRREILVYDLNGFDPHEVFERVNDLFDRNGERQNVNITLAPIKADQVPDWLGNNLHPTWWERLTGRIRWSLWRV